ncbi:MAG TPA: BatA and WFA domain-containing protein [Acidimicrobiia bacterium]|nr:BatA and WFA domain-containing protein [Acidimicrobiia bacterium]
MSFLIPAAFGLGALAGPLIVLYMLRSRRPRVEVASTMLWEKAEVPVSSAVPWQKLRWTPLLLLQLAVLAAFVVTLARPFYRERTLLGPHTVFVVDTSGSMAMADRIGTARERALALTRDLSEANQVSVVEASPHPRVLVAFARDPELVQEAMGSLQAGGGRADLSTAIQLARGLATPDRPTNILIFSDGGDAPLPEEPVVGAEMVRFDDFGPNLAISAWSLEPSTEGTTRAFLNVSNFGAEDRSVQAGVSVNGLDAGLLDLEVPALGSARLTTPIDAGPGDVVSVRLTNHQDALALDDEASLIVGAGPERYVALRGEGSPFLEALVDAVPGFTTEGEGAPDVSVVDGGPIAEIDRPTWLIAPETVPEGVTVSALAGNLAVTYQRPGEPILDLVDLSTMVVGEAQVVEAPRWLTLVRSGDVPLILLGEVNGHRVAYFTFDLTRSNLPVQVGFPILGVRLLEWLAGSATGSVSTDQAGTPIPLAAPPGSVARVILPDGSIRPLTEGAVEFGDTSQPGVYRVEYFGADGQMVPGITAIRTFVADESAGGSRLIATTGQATEAEEASTRLREWAPWVIAAVLLLMATEWWVGHQRPFLRRATA